MALAASLGAPHPPSARISTRVHRHVLPARVVLERQFVEAPGVESLRHVDPGSTPKKSEVRLARRGDGVQKRMARPVCKQFYRERRLMIDNAGWHGEAGLSAPDGVRLIFPPPYTPQLQPAETLWALVDEPIVNKHIETLDELDAIIGERCAALTNERGAIESRAGFHWWPKIAKPK